MNSTSQRRLKLSHTVVERLLTKAIHCKKKGFWGLLYIFNYPANQLIWLKTFTKQIKMVLKKAFLFSFLFSESKLHVFENDKIGEKDQIVTLTE